MKNVLITGANRGIGLELVRQYLEEGHRIYACCRNPQNAEALEALASPDLSIHALDVTNPEMVAALAAELHGTPIHILINNAGIYGPRLSFGSVDYEAWRQVLAVNTMAPLRMVEHFVEHLAAGSGIIANIGSKVGSVADNNSGGSYMYRSSKSALNMVTKSLSIDLKDRGIITVVIHPGWVQTDMGGPNALINTNTSASGIHKVIAGLDAGQNGMFFNYDGSVIPW